MFMERDYEEFKKQKERLDLVEPVLDVLLTKNIVSERGLYDNLVRLHGPRMANDLFDLIVDYINDDSFKPGKLRVHDVDAPRNIRKSKDALNDNEHYKEAHKSLLNRKVPGEQERIALYGQHADSAMKSDILLLDSGRFRKCWTPIVVHPNRVSAMIGELDFDKEVYDGDPFHFRFLGKVHDTIEEVISIGRDEKGRVYGLDRIHVLMDDLDIPDTMRNHLVEITNVSDLIFRAMLEDYRFSINKQKSKITKEDIFNSLDILSGMNYDIVSPHALEIRKFLEDKDLPPGKGWETAKWFSYFGVYLNDLANNSVSDRGRMKNSFYSLGSDKSDYRTFQTKQLDIGENNLNKYALNIEDQIKNIIKAGDAGRRGSNLNSGWGPLNDFSKELSEVSFIDGKRLVSIPLYARNDALDHFSVAFKYVEALQSVFYEDTEPANIHEVMNR